MTMVERRTKYVKPQWDDIVDRAKAANGLWVLGAQAVPLSVLRTVRQGRNAKVNRAEGRLFSKPGERATTEDGITVVDMYVRWEWTPGFEPPIAGAQSSGFSRRKLTMPKRVGEALREAAAVIDAPRGEILRRAVAEIAVRGTSYTPPETVDLTFEVNDYVWEQAQDQVAEAGVPFHPALLQELRRQIRLAGKKRESPSPK